MNRYNPLGKGERSSLYNGYSSFYYDRRLYNTSGDQRKKRTSSDLKYNLYLRVIEKDKTSTGLQTLPSLGTLHTGEEENMTFERPGD